MSQNDPPTEPDLPEGSLPPGFLRDPVHFLAFGFGSGAMPRAPGTWGSLAAIPIWYTFSWLPQPIYWAVVALAFIVGVWLCGKTARDLKVHDHGGIVWDEFVGMWIALGLFPDHIAGVLLAFVMFRLFDIIKPWPINWLDERLPGGFGIMVDDVVAAIMALVCLYLIDVWIVPQVFS
jgi:phosphatidylglycerophosphatase A